MRVRRQASDGALDRDGWRAGKAASRCLALSAVSLHWVAHPLKGKERMKSQPWRQHTKSHPDDAKTPLHHFRLSFLDCMVRRPQSCKCCASIHLTGAREEFLSSTHGEVQLPCMLHMCSLCSRHNLCAGKRVPSASNQSLVD